MNSKEENTGPKENEKTQLPAVPVTDQVPDLLLRIREEIRQIQNPTGRKPDLSGKIEGNDINEMTDITELVRLRTSVNLSASAFNKELENLKNDPQFQIIKLPETWEHEGGTAEEWCAYIDSRILEVSKSERLAKLKAAEKEFSKFETKEQQIKNAIQNVTALFKD